MDNSINFKNYFDECWIGKRISHKTGNFYTCLFIRKGDYVKQVGFMDEANCQIFDKIPFYDETKELHYKK